MKKYAGLVVLSIVGLPRPAYAYRPFDGTDAAVADDGEFELELGPVGYLRSGTDDLLVAPKVVANLGIAPDLEAVLEGQGLHSLDGGRAEPRTRLVDTGAFLKAVLIEGTLQEKSGPSLALEVGSLLPTWHDEPGFGYQATLIVSHRLSFATLHINLAAARSRAGNAEGFWGAIAEGPFRWTLRPVLEAFYERELTASRTISGLGGAIWTLSDALSLDAAVRWSRVDTEREIELRAGLSWAFEVWKSR